MQHQIKYNIDQAIHENNISKLRSCLDSLQYLLAKNNDSVGYFSDYLTNLLTHENFLNLGGAIYVFSISLEMLNNVTQDHDQEIIQLLRLAQEKVDDLSIRLIKKITFEQAINEQSIPIRDCITVIESKISQMSTFSEEYFLMILEMIGNEVFLRLDKSWELLVLFQTEWSSITDRQKEQLIVELENTYGKSKDWMFDFIISELLGEYYSNEPAFEVLRRLSKIDKEESRALVPHGLEHLIKDSGNIGISTKAHRLLLNMKQDSSELVRNEVIESLRKLDV